MFKNIFGPASQPAAEKTERAFTDATAGETENGPADRRPARVDAAGARAARRHRPPTSSPGRPTRI
jgi:hypothetical protein